VFLASKFGFRPDGKGGTMVDTSPAYAKVAVERSLARLGTDHIDLYYAHRIDPMVPIEETVGAMGELVREGKVRYIGVCEAAAANIRKANLEYPLAAVQSEYSLLTRDPDASVLPVCMELGIAFVPYSPLSRGLVTPDFPDTGTLDAADFRRTLPRFSGANLENNRKLAAGLGEIAAAAGCTPAQLALAWILSRGEYIIPIPGTKRVKYLEENAAAAEVALSEKTLADIAALLARYPDVGQRYDQANLGLVNR